MEEHEIWKQIEDSHYSVSNFGRVRNDKVNLVLNPFINSKGYLHIDLHRKTTSVHRLVALAFVEIPKELLGFNLIVNHVDNNRLNNNYTNLAWIRKSFKTDLNHNMTILNEEEIWKQIDSSYYSVSNFGRVKNDRSDLLLNPYLNSSGYLEVCIERITKTVHRLVAITFTELPEGFTYNELTVDHDDDNKLNNHYANLVWMTNSENLAKAHKTGAINNKGSNHPLAILTEENIPEIKFLIKEGFNQKEIAELFNVNHVVISKIKKGKAWSHINE